MSEEVHKLSTGDPSTLGSYLKLCRAFFGPESEATSFVKQKMADSPHGKDEVVIADESQMVYLLMTMHAKWLKEKPPSHPPESIPPLRP